VGLKVGRRVHHHTIKFVLNLDICPNDIRTLFRVKATILNSKNLLFKY